MKILRILFCLIPLSLVAAPPADETHNLDMSGVSRSYKIHVPKGLGASRSPLVVILHGGGGNGDSVAQNSGMLEKADREQFIVAYPDGVGRQPRAYTWNAGRCCAFAMQQHSPDVEFVGKMMDEIEKQQRIDPKRVYVTGMSNGGMLTHRIAGALAPRVAAAAIVSGALFEDQPKPSQPVSILIFHGTDDQVVPFQGGKSPNATVAGSMQGEFPPVKSAFDFWSKADGCTGAASETSGAVIKRTYETCRNGSAVVLYEIPGRGHEWPGGGRGAAAPLISATDVMWTFFLAHPQK